MVSRRDWEISSPTYRAREMEILAGWIRAGESGSVIGLAGAGKSNLLGFLCHQPHVMADQYLHGRFGLVLVLVDLNNLPDNDPSTFYRVILRSLYEARGQLTAIKESLPDTVQDLYHKIEEKTDPFVSQSALREVLFSFVEGGARLVLVMDPFDRFCRVATTQILDNLRGLRDSFKATLSYIVGLRCELTYIRDPIEMGELYDILDTHVCWLGPMQSEDARSVINQMEERIAQSLDDRQVKWLIDVTGGYPALLRAASLWLAQAPPRSDVLTWEKQLLAEPSIQNRLNDVWQGLTGEEQAVLSVLHTPLSIAPERDQTENVRQVEERHRHVLNRLKAKHLCTQAGTGWEMFSPLFARFVASVKGIAAGRIEYDPQTDRFFRGERELADLSGQDRRLLRHFLDRPMVAHSIDDLADAAWAEYDSSGVTDETVQQAIRHLRKRLELNPAQPRYVITQRGVGYRFVPEGVPQAQ